MSTAHADPFTDNDGNIYETCDGVVCLVMDDIRAGNWTYEGIRPFITDWKADQPYLVQYNGEDVGSYTVKIEDYWNSFYSSSAYQFGNFVANPALADDFDLKSLGNFGYLDGASMYQVTIGDFTNLTINDVGPHDMNYWVMSFGDINYSVVTDPINGVSAGLIQIAEAAPAFLWNSLFHSDIELAAVPDYLLPADPFASLDFNPSDYLDLGSLLGM
ncbi:hypothetical protein [Mycolicibacter senuensis]|nr:hypothetical protein [Mycolicibacter senuensis]MDQ2627970.1 hypothetical protein [Actinomycetota bacterium]ORW66987.1 hypothetical protein AWC24_11965 [Mycolicibacter senuensis]